MTADDAITPAILLQHMQGMKHDLQQQMQGMETRLRGEMHLMNQGLEGKIDKIDRRLSFMAVGIENLDKRLDDIELAFIPKKLAQHDRRIRRLEKHTGLIAA